MPLVKSLLSKLNKSGDTMTGPLVLPANPVASMQATTKQYTDSAAEEIAAGFLIVKRQDIRDVVTTLSGEGSVYGFIARKALLCTQVKVNTSDTAGVGLTLARIGIYTVDSGGAMTLVASTANSVTGYNAVYNGVTTALSASYTFIPGQQYAVMTLFVGTTPPKMVAAAGSGDWGVNALLPRLCGKIGGLTDLPSTQANTGYTDAGSGTNVIMLA